MAPTRKTYPPQTAREVLAVFFPLHDTHTVLSYAVIGKGVDMVCSCSQEPLRLNEAAVKTMCALKDLKEALRNVPVTRP